MNKLRTALVVLLASLLVVAFALDRHRRQAELDHLEERLLQASRAQAPTQPTAAPRPEAHGVASPARSRAARSEDDTEALHDEKPFASRLENAFRKEGPAAEDPGDRSATQSKISAALKGGGEIESLGCRSTMCRAELVVDDAAALNETAMRVNLPLAVASYEERKDGRLHAVVFLGHEDDVQLDIPEAE